ncbi:hypothetical protein PVAND_002615 [Polypedilum vanderplanki]|uniref:DUF659 domain-containing protein n=1 Tax=Polypedilum vanderplanki TaxID=319348 RepID=A0A9J6BRI6_POLVA|nr:hypothetical protein PVAND_002615 [Polypedilum vanderplanki]
MRNPYLDSLLDKHFNKCSAAVDEIIESHENLTLISDGWTNVRGDHIVNFCVKAPGQKAFFYESIDTSGIIQNSTAVAAAIFDVIEKIGSHKFICFISDNAPVMKAAWKLIEVKFPHISASGCAAHGMNLLIKDITSTTESAKTIKESEKIIKFIKNHHLVKAMFDERRLAANVLSSLCLPVPTPDEKYDELKDMQPKSTSAAVLTLLKRMLSGIV